MPRLAAALALMLVLAAPHAAAFPASDVAVDIAWDAGASPVVLVSGALTMAGAVESGLFAIGLADATFGPLAELTLTEPDPLLGARETTYRDVRLVMHAGSLAWSLPEGAKLGVQAAPAYALGVTLPDAPFGAQEEKTGPSPGLLLTGPGLAIELAWSGATADLIPLDATVSIQDRTGKPLTGWDHRRVNQAGSGSGFTSDRDGAAFRIQGGFAATLRAEAVAAGLGASPNFALTVTAAEEDRLAESLAGFERMAERLGGGNGDPERPSAGGPLGGGPLEALSAFSGLLNGALLILAPPSESGTPPAEPTHATLNGEPAELGPFSLMRSHDLELGWSDGSMRVQGTSSVAVTKDGLAVDAPARFGFFPIASLLLWALAVGAIVVFFVKRPPKGQPRFHWRATAAAVNVLVLLVVFWLWDRSFAETFGTSFLTRAAEVGFSADTIGQLGTLFGLQMIPWSIAALAFALPVRIATGVGLRYLGRGKSLKGFANAAGLVALATLGPFYALWLLDALIGGIVAGMAAR